MTSVEGFARSGDVELWYRVEGEGPDAVLLIMGLGGRVADWGSLPGTLAQRFRVVVFDNRGSGRSTKPPAGWTLDDMARDAVAVLDAVGIERAHVAGVSMGGMIAQLVALDHAARVRRLVLMSTNFGGPGIVRPGPEIVGIFQPPRGTPPDQITRDAMRLISAPGFAEQNPQIIDTLVELALAEPTPKAMFMAQLQAILGSDRSARVRDIAAPTLIVHGDQDRLIPVGNGRLLAERIPGAALEILPGVGHMPMWEAPTALAGALQHFLEVT